MPIIPVSMPSQPTIRRVQLGAFVLALMSATFAIAQELWPAPAKPLKAQYNIYSGELHNAQPPTRTERKLAIEISGQAAKDIFASLYPDAKVTCSGEPGERLRAKGELWCSFSPSSGYRCWLGYDLRAGKVIGGASC
ncbi:hypothetical protein [Janthinobacterium aquaticum]|uniref:hypothetical protein n=1 Tax=Janthinobacterium sp. FT58W TaxID=2654254 RepID=UPI001263EB5D|nr:hypothetical protein [Janthinobacterium sp. FT58W]KAB8041365.1 hypothetical protein GCM43_18220 [Janthinobacterium sp. FT58W]